MPCIPFIIYVGVIVKAILLNVSLADNLPPCSEYHMYHVDEPCYIESEAEKYSPWERQLNDLNRLYKEKANQHSSTQPEATEEDKLVNIVLDSSIFPL